MTVCVWVCLHLVCFFKQKTAYEMRISDWSSDVCSSDLAAAAGTGGGGDGKHAVGAGRAMSATKANHEGGCACGAVRYRAAGDLRPVVACHCSQCRKAFTNYGAFTAVERAGLSIENEDEVTWHASALGVGCGCGRHCGSALFGERRAADYISIAAGTLDQPRP